MTEEELAKLTMKQCIACGHKCEDIKNNLCRECIIYQAKHFERERIRRRERYFSGDDFSLGYSHPGQGMARLRDPYSK